MQCPSCALYHPARYERCVSCGAKLVPDGELVRQPPAVSTKHSRGATALDSGRQAPKEEEYDEEDGEDEEEETKPRKRKKGGLPTAMGIAIAGFILCASAGGTYFFLTKPPENERLLQDGQRQLTLGQYAFALKTLSEAAKIKSNDPRVLLALARAYVGVDQVEKAWECITQAQTMGAGVVSDPALASDLANYYRQHNQYKRAIELLRPLAAQNVRGKKAELADLDAAFGDECMRTGDLDQAMRAWEEVKDMKEGSRATEADSRLASIYQKVAEKVSVKGDPDDALKYYAKLNAMAPSAGSYERAAELYQKLGNVSLAIDQMEKAVKCGGDTSVLNHKLAAMMAARGKELIDKGEVDSGYGYLQKAQSLDTHIRVPSATVRHVHVDIEPGTGLVHLNAEVWNPGPADLGSVTVKGDLFDTKNAKSLWTKEQRVIDEFVPPLAVHESKAFELISAVPAADPTTTELRVYLNNNLYKTYPLVAKGAKPAGTTANTGATTAGDPNAQPGNAWQLAPRIQPPGQTTTGAPQPAPNTAPFPATAPGTGPNTAAPAPGPSSEEKTLKDLD